MKSLFRNTLKVLSHSLNHSSSNKSSIIPATYFSSSSLKGHLSRHKGFLDFIKFERLHESIRAVSSEIKFATLLMQSSFRQPRPVPEVLEEANVQLDVLRRQFHRLAEILQERPGRIQDVVSKLALMHWLQTGDFLFHHEVEEKLGFDTSKFFLDLEDYHTGDSSYYAEICFMSNELNQVRAGDCDCPIKAMKFLKNLHGALLMLDLPEGLRKMVDDMVYDLIEVKIVYRRLKIQGFITSGDSSGEEEMQK
ncbi:hypothetical protein NE237_004204 [Protea cynaroides]|uniref:Uncharacterized protein n=1 Tax=Protea cynaroides TaxID=273540 RepID=A0A9Q0KIH8_9MAGN|nr:hypothetical protein NE237_004204 [Protea cynaroides]